MPLSFQIRPPCTTSRACCDMSSGAAPTSRQPTQKSRVSRTIRPTFQHLMALQRERTKETAAQAARQNGNPMERPPGTRRCCPCMHCARTPIQITVLCADVLSCSGCALHLFLALCASYSVLLALLGVRVRIKQAPELALVGHLNLDDPPILEGRGVHLRRSGRDKGEATTRFRLGAL